MTTLRRAHAIGQRPDKVGDRRHHCRRRLAVRAETLAHRLDQRRADHDAVGACRDRACLLGRAHAEADADWKLGMPLDACDRGDSDIGR